jgi:hypothetical protein
VRQQRKSQIYSNKGTNAVLDGEDGIAGNGGIRLAALNVNVDIDVVAKVHTAQSTNAVVSLHAEDKRTFVNLLVNSDDYEASITISKDIKGKAAENKNLIWLRQVELIRENQVIYECEMI